MANIIVLALLTYAAAGAVFAMVFLSFGLPRFDPAAKGAGVRFRVLIAPGCAALWPVVMVKWIQSTRHRAESES